MSAASLISPIRRLSKQPEVRPTPLAALALDELPTELHFVRSHFAVPAQRAQSWVLELAGAVDHRRSWSLLELQRRPSQTQTVVLECAGHRRNEFQPATAGLQWGVGAISEARWTGVPLAELLAEASPTNQGCEMLFEGADRGLHPSSTDELPFARSITLEHALTGDVLIAWQMNGKPIPRKHGGPLRAIVPGHYGVASVKWLRHIEVLKSPFQGPFQVQDYHLDGEPLQELRISSLILTPEAHTLTPAGPIKLSGIAWGGHGGIATVEFRLAGTAWRAATIQPQQQASALTRWSGVVEVPAGEQVVEVRAHDRSGNTQPEQPQWNPLGYANNSIHRLPITALHN